MSPTSRVVAGATALAALLAAGGCSFRDARDLPLPGAAGRGGYEVRLTFTDVGNLVPRETCRSGDTIVGSVVSVELDEQLQAEVVCRIEQDVELPANVTGALRTTSLLGERYVSLELPRGVTAEGTLEPGAVVPVGSTRFEPDTELVLGALSQVLNGGSLGSVATISRELTTALEGRTDRVRGATRSLARVVSDLDRNRDSLVATLEAVADLSGTLEEQRDVIAATLDDVPAGLAVLERQRPRLVTALARIDRLSGTVVPLLQRSGRATVADLEHLAPLLDQLARTGRDLAPSLERISSFPFNSNTLQTIKGDYSGAFVQANLDLDTVALLLNDLADQEGQEGPDLPAPIDPADPGLPTSPVPGAPDLDELLGGVPGLGGLLGGLGQGSAQGDRSPPEGLGGLLTGPLRRSAR